MSVAVLGHGVNEYNAMPRHIQQAYLRAVTRLALARIPIRTGASRGCDQIAGRAALQLGGLVELVLPWPTFEKAWVDEMCATYPNLCAIEVYDPEIHTEWTLSVDKYKLPEEVMTPERFKRYARCWGIVQPAETVLSMTQGSERGGTGQGMRIARGLGKVVLDVRHDEDRSQLDLWVLGMPNYFDRRPGA
jgi:hypothetical protein